MTDRRSLAGSRSVSASAADQDMSISGDIDRFLADPVRSFGLFHSECSIDYQVTDVRDGRVDVMFSLPVGLSRSFMSFLTSMHEFMRLLDRQSDIKAAQNKSVDPVEIEKRRQFQLTFQQQVYALFDQFSGQGMEAKEAIKATNHALKEENHPWATHEGIRSIIRASGRLKKQNAKGGE